MFPFLVRLSNQSTHSSKDIMTTHANYNELSMGPMQLENVNKVWNGCLDQLERGSTEVVVTAEARTCLGRDGLQVVADRYRYVLCPLKLWIALTNYSDYIGAAAHILHDSLLDATRILPPPMFLPSATRRFQPYVDNDPLALPGSTAANDIQQSASVQARNPTAKIAKARMARVPRPPNAFILYRQHHHHRIKSENPDIKNNEISKLVGAVWANEKKDVKDYFVRKAIDLKAQHAKMHPGYQYTPRKASEKKRRSSQKKRTPASSAVDPPNTKPLQSDELVPSFMDENEPDTLTHDLLSGQSGLTDQMAEKHNDISGPDPLAPGEDPPVLYTSMSVDAHEDHRAQFAGVADVQLSPDSLGHDFTAVSAQDAGFSTVNPQNLLWQDFSQLEDDRMIGLAPMMEGNDYFLGPLDEDFGGIDFATLSGFENSEYA